MVSPVSLANMEYMLYGNTGAGYSNAAPSMLNNYMLQYPDATYVSPYGYGQYGYNPAFGQTIPSIYSQYAPQNAQQANEMSFEGFTQDDVNKLSDYYAKNNVYEEGLAGAALGGLSWMAIENFQSIVHPLNAKKGILKAEEVFKNVSKESWKKNSILMQDAYTAVQQAWRDTCPKKAWSGWLRKPIDEKAVEPLIKEMETAIAKGDEKAIALATQRLQAARGFDGRLIPGKKLTVADRLAKKSSEIEKGAGMLLEANSGAFGNIVKNTFKKDFRGFMVFETLANAGKIYTAFQEDTKTGLIQTAQSTGKAAAGTAGWCVGRAAGTKLGGWAAAKVGAKFGSKLRPGIGTLIGGIIGFAVGSIGMCFGHKVGEKVFGTDVANKVEAKQLAQSQEGQAYLLQFAAQKTMEGKADPRTQQIVYKALNAYA